MIAVQVEFELPQGMSRDEVLRLFRVSANGWLKNHDLVDKFYLLDGQKWRGGGLYLWRSREAAERHHGPDYVRTIAERYGSQPTIRFLDAVLRVEPAANRITELERA